MSAADDGDQESLGNASSIYAAIARTATRSLALYFSRPVRLFRPSKVTGWQTLRLLATHHGHSLSPSYISWLVKQHGPSVLAKHFIPPMTVNILLGSVLWTTYSEASTVLEPYIRSPIALAALSGAVAGATQAVIAAPAENVRFVLEGASSTTGWSHAWQEVFRGTSSNPQMSRKDQIHEAREVRDWMREVGEMAGRGWNGWLWGVAKDFCGFAVFFSAFELTRRTATKARLASLTLVQQGRFGLDARDKFHRHMPRVVHAVTLVSGGAVAGLLVVSAQHHSISSILLRKVRDEGWMSFVRNSVQHVHDTSTSPVHRKLQSLVRTLARVGPWGIGFLVWEAFGPGIS